MIYAVYSIFYWELGVQASFLRYFERLSTQVVLTYLWLANTDDSLLQLCLSVSIDKLMLAR